MWKVTVAGLLADIIGFTIIVFEWHRTFKYTEEIRQQQLQDAYERNEAREQGREAEYRLEAEEETIAKEFSRLRYKEAVFRERLFYVGVGLVVLGFALQVIGALPGF
jgi:hypothetical protein